MAGERGLMWGGGPADIMGPALDKIFAEFEEVCHRKPTAAELRAGIMFSARPMLKDETEVPAEA